MLFRSNIGTCCKYKDNLGAWGKVTITMALKFLANYLTEASCTFLQLLSLLSCMRVMI